MPVLLATNKKNYFVQLCVESKRYYLGTYGTRFKAEVIEREGLTAYEQGGQAGLTEFQNTLNYKRVGARKQPVTRGNTIAILGTFANTAKVLSLKMIDYENNNASKK